MATPVHISVKTTILQCKTRQKTHRLQIPRCGRKESTNPQGGGKKKKKRRKKIFPTPNIYLQDIQYSTCQLSLTVQPTRCKAGVCNDRRHGTLNADFPEHPWITPPLALKGRGRYRKINKRQGEVTYTTQVYLATKR